MDPIPSSKGVVAVAGKEPPKFRIDLNRDGMDDIQQLLALAKQKQPLAEGVLRFIMFALATFGKTHTKVYKYLDAYFTQYKPQLDAVLDGPK